MNGCKKYIAKITAFILIMVASFGVTVTAANAATAVTSYTSAGVTYTYNNKVLTITGSGTVTNAWQDQLKNSSGTLYKGSITKVIFNSSSLTGCNANSFDGCSKLVTVQITDYHGHNFDTTAFSGNTNITTVTIGNNITSIGSNAFKGCTALKTLTIGTAVTSIGSNAFEGCSNLATLTFKSTSQCKTIGNSAFKNTKLASVTIPDSVTSIGSSAFYGCSSLNTIVIGKGVTSIGSDAFYNAPLSTQIQIKAANLITHNNVFQNKSTKTITISSGVIKIPSGLFKGCTNDSLTSVTIPNTCTEIGSSAFEGCTTIKTVTYQPKNASIIGEKAFYNCTALSNIKYGSTNRAIYKNVTSIGNYAFANTALTSINITNGVETVGNYAFSGCTSMNTLTIGTDVTSIGTGAFNNAPLSTKIIYNAINLSSHGNSLNGKTTATITLGTKVTKLPSNLFTSCTGITKITIPDSCTEIGASAFKGCSNLATVTFNSGSKLTTIGNNAFENCTSIASFTLPLKLTSMGTDIFKGCTNFKQVTILCENISSFNGNFGAAIDKKDNGSLPATYKQTAAPSASTLEEVIIGSKVTKIPDYAFTNADNLKYIHIQGTKVDTAAHILTANSKGALQCGALKTIGDFAFAGVGELEAMFFSPKVTSIGESAYDFYNELGTSGDYTTNANLSKVEVSHTVEAVSDYEDTGIAKITMEVTSQDGIDVTEVSQDYIFILDLTGSMANSVTYTETDSEGNETTTNGTKMKASGIAFESLLNTLSKVSPNSRIAVIGYYSGKAKVLCDWTGKTDNNFAWAYEVAELMKAGYYSTSAKYNETAKKYNGVGLESVCNIADSSAGGTNYSVGILGALNFLASREHSNDVNVVFMSDGGHNGGNLTIIDAQAKSLAAISKNVWSIGVCIEKDTQDTTRDYSKFTYKKETIYQDVDTGEVDEDGNPVIETKSESVIVGIKYDEDESYTIDDLLDNDAYNITYDGKDIQGNKKVSSITYVSTSVEGAYNPTMIQRVSAYRRYYNIGKEDNVAHDFAEKFKAFVSDSSSIVKNLMIYDMYNAADWEFVSSKDGYTSPTAILCNGSSAYVDCQLGYTYNETTGEFEKQTNKFYFYVRLKDTSRKNNPNILVTSSAKATYEVDQSGNVYYMQVVDDTDHYLPWYQTLKVNPNGGTWRNSTDVTTINLGTGETTTIEQPVKEYWTHLSWELTGTGSKLYKAGTKTNYTVPGSAAFVQGSSNSTITAKWRANILTLTYNANGGVFGSSSEFTQQIYCDTNADGSYKKYTLTGTAPTRTGYTFKGWSMSRNWSDDANSRYTSSSAAKTAIEWASIFGVQDALKTGDTGVTLYAQWEKVLTHTFYYYNNSSKSVTVVWHNDDAETKTITIPVEARATNVTYNGSSDWAFRGFGTTKLANAVIKIAPTQATMSVCATDTNTSYYASYQRNVTITYIDYGTDKKITRTDSGTAYLNYVGTTVDYTLIAYSLNEMKYTEASAGCRHNITGEYSRCEACKQESWKSRGWTTNTAQNAGVEVKAGAAFKANRDTTYYGLYEKDVKLTYDANGGTVNPSHISYTRYANAVDVSKATTSTYTLAVPQYLENGISKYIWCGWLYKQLGINEESDMFADYLVGTTNNQGSFTYTPLVSDTVYAYWAYEPPRQVAPLTIISKSAEWATPTSDNSTVDFDNLQNIDIDGIAKVTVKVKITDNTGVGARTIKITDYFDTDKWDYYQDSNNKPNVSSGSFTRSGDTIVWSVSDGYTSGQEMTLTYYVKIKESYWDVEADTDEYINAIQDLISYKNELDADGSLKSTSTYQTKDKKALINLNYIINGGLLSGISVSKYNSTPYVVMRQVSWLPTVSLDYGIGIESDTNNIYQDKSSDYENTYFVKYDTKGEDSTFRLFELSQIRRSYSYYQITDNLMDMRTAASTQEVIDNFLAVNSTRGGIWCDATGTKLSDGFSAAELLKVVSADNIRSSVTTNGIIYKTAALTSYDTVYATNNDGLKISVYPFIRTTNSKTGITYETTRDTDVLKNKRIDLVIDASDPIITPPDSGKDIIRTEDEDGNKWTESDGYMDINLVDNATNPEPAAKTLTFTFEDEVSGINSPNADDSDWIEASNQNVQITLERVDNDPIMIFDSGLVPSNQNDVVKVTYDNTSTMNKSGNIKVILDPTNKDILGHLRLTIKVIDNVSNYTEKIYDIYVFCLTGAVEISDTLPDYLTRTLELNRFANGESGYVKVSAGGYVDRVTLDYGAYLEKLYDAELSIRKNFTSDTVTSINGDYPYDDAKNAGTSEDSSMTYLPYSMQVNTWGYTDDKLGGLKLSEVNLSRQTYTVDNSILQKHLTDLIKRYQGMNQGTGYEVEKGSDYAIIGSTLYTYPVMNGDSVTSYVDKYEFGGETYYDDVLYPAYVTLDGTKGITITYESAAPDIKEPDANVDDESDTESEEKGLRRKIAASVEDTTQIIVSNWVQAGDGYLRPFLHYFFMPLEAEEKDVSNPYYVTLTSYKDSEKEFVHSVTVRLSFYNDIESIHKKLETYIKDN